MGQYALTITHAGRAYEYTGSYKRMIAKRAQAITRGYVNVSDVYEKGTR